MLAAAGNVALPASTNGEVAQEVGPTVGAPVGPVDGLTMGKPVELAEGLSVGESVGAVGWERGARGREAMLRRWGAYGARGRRLTVDATVGKVEGLSVGS